MAAPGSLQNTVNFQKPSSPCPTQRKLSARPRSGCASHRSLASASRWSNRRPHLSCHAKKRQQQLAEEDGMRETEAVAGATVQDDLEAELAQAEEAASASCSFEITPLQTALFSSHLCKSLPCQVRLLIISVRSMLVGGLTDQVFALLMVSSAWLHQSGMQCMTAFLNMPESSGSGWHWQTPAGHSTHTWYCATPRYEGSPERIVYAIAIQSSHNRMHVTCTARNVAGQKSGPIPFWVSIGFNSC